LAVAVAVDVPGAYCTVIVQLPPGLRTVVELQVPPAMIEKVPPAVPTFAIDGAAVKVNGPAFAPVAVLLTVMVPVLVVVLAVVVVNAGLGPEKVTVAPVTLNATALLAPVGVETVTLRGPCAAPFVIVQFAVRLVAVLGAGPVIVQVTPVPDTFTVVATVRLVPPRVTGTMAPLAPLVGRIELSPAPVAVPVSADVCVPAASVTDNVADSELSVSVANGAN
jgi:hypothetical protein